MIKGLVSCIVPTYRRSDTLSKAIDSILQQSYYKLEILIVDDNEPNDEYSRKVQSILRSYEDKRIKYLQQTHHKNGAAARNFGIRNANGEYIAFLDDDDTWEPEKIEKQIAFLNLNKEFAGVSCLFAYYRNGKFVRRSPPYSSDHLHKKVLDVLFQ